MLRGAGLPLVIVGQLDCEGLPQSVAVRVAESLTHFMRDIGEVTEFSAAVRDRTTVNVVLEEETRRHDTDAPMTVAEDLIPHFLCSRDERGSLLARLVPEEIIAEIDFSGTPRMAALRTILAVEDRGLLEELQSGMLQLEDERESTY